MSFFEDIINARYRDEVATRFYRKLVKNNLQAENVVVKSLCCVDKQQISSEEVF